MRVDKEKQIIEIKECVDNVYGADCAYFDVDGFAIANEIYNAGYRRQSETAEKFARAILKDVNHYSKDYKNPAFGSSWIENKVKEIAAQFGAKIK